jgi:YD repeat-containing protein
MVTMQIHNIVIAFSIVIAVPADAAETITYKYDAKGRLVKVVRTGTVNNNVTYDYVHDKANNRKKVKVTNSPNPPPPT